MIFFRGFTISIAVFILENLLFYRIKIRVIVLEIFENIVKILKSLKQLIKTISYKGLATIKKIRKR